MSSGVVPTEELLFREGHTRDLKATHLVQGRAMHDVAQRMGAAPAGPPPSDAEIAAEWKQARPMYEFLAAQPGSYWVCEEGPAVVGYARCARFGVMEQLTELFVEPSHHRRGIGRALMERCWPGAPTPELGRLVVAAGSNADMSLYTAFGTMPVTGHWHMRCDTSSYLEQRAHQDTDVKEPGVHALAVDRAVAEWKRLEPAALGHERPALHEFFGRDRACLATLDGDEASALCWVSSSGGIGPAIGRTPEDLVPVVLAALDRVAMTKEPDHLSVFCTTSSWWLLRRLRELGFRLHWASWVMSSVPLPALDRYVPSSPPWVL